MAHYKLILAYEGTQYHGFQRQKNKANIQAEVEAALRKLGWQGRAIIPAGRTDSGVHALGQVISFNFDWKHGDATLRAPVRGRSRLNLTDASPALPPLPCTTYLYPHRQAHQW